MITFRSKAGILAVTGAADAENENGSDVATLHVAAGRGFHLTPRRLNKQ